jgi:uncharacterized membrane protein YbhN (UPF0104 family)
MLIASFIFLFAGFIGDTISLKQVLKKSNYRIALSDCLAGVGLSVFAKYIPGKILTIVGPAAYIAEKRHHSLGKLSAISLNAQLIDLWVGLIWGAIGLFLLSGIHLWIWLILCLWLGLTVVIFSKQVHGSAEYLIKIVLRKEIKIPSLTIKSTLSVMPWFVVSWALYSTGFYMLCITLTVVDVPWSAGLGFPLAATLGVMALITPGGLGVREGVMVSYLVLARLPLAEATTIAVASRLWFLLGEIFMFIVGWVSENMSRRALYQTGCEQNVGGRRLSSEARKS